jgi:hypothetical protein
MIAFSGLLLIVGLFLSAPASLQAMGPTGRLTKETVMQSAVQAQAVAKIRKGMQKVLTDLKPLAQKVTTEKKESLKQAAETVSEKRGRLDLYATKLDTLQKEQEAYVNALRALDSHKKKVFFVNECKKVQRNNGTLTSDENEIFKHLTNPDHTVAAIDTKVTKTKAIRAAIAKFNSDVLPYYSTAVQQREELQKLNQAFETYRDGSYKTEKTDAAKAKNTLENHQRVITAKQQEVQASVNQYVTTKGKLDAIAGLSDIENTKEVAAFKSLKSTLEQEVNKAKTLLPEIEKLIKEVDNPANKHFAAKFDTLKGDHSAVIEAANIALQATTKEGLPGLYNAFAGIVGAYPAAYAAHQQMRLVNGYNASQDPAKSFISGTLDELDRLRDPVQVKILNIIKDAIPGENDEKNNASRESSEALRAFFAQVGKVVAALQKQKLPEVDYGVGQNIATTAQKFTNAAANIKKLIEGEEEFAADKGHDIALLTGAQAVVIDGSQADKDLFPNFTHEVTAEDQPIIKALMDASRAALTTMSGEATNAATALGGFEADPIEVAMNVANNGISGDDSLTYDGVDYADHKGKTAEEIADTDDLEANITKHLKVMQERQAVIKKTFDSWFDKDYFGLVSQSAEAQAFLNWGKGENDLLTVLANLAARINTPEKQMQSDLSGYLNAEGMNAATFAKDFEKIKDNETKKAILGKKELNVDGAAGCTIAHWLAFNNGEDQLNTVFTGEGIGTLINAKNTAGNTALHMFAGDNGKVNAVKALINHGDIDLLATGEGHTVDSPKTVYTLIPGDSAAINDLIKATKVHADKNAGKKKDYAAALSALSNKITDASLKKEAQALAHALDSSIALDAGVLSSLFEEKVASQYSVGFLKNLDFLEAPYRGDRLNACVEFIKTHGEISNFVTQAVGKIGQYDQASILDAALMLSDTSEKEGNWEPGVVQELYKELVSWLNKVIDSENYPLTAQNVRSLILHHSTTELSSQEGRTITHLQTALNTQKAAAVAFDAVVRANYSDNRASKAQGILSELDILTGEGQRAAVAKEIARVAKAENPPYMKPFNKDNYGDLMDGLVEGGNADALQPLIVAVKAALNPGVGQPPVEGEDTPPVDPVDSDDEGEESDEELEGLSWANITEDFDDENDQHIQWASDSLRKSLSSGSDEEFIKNIGLVNQTGGADKILGHLLSVDPENLKSTFKTTDSLKEKLGGDPSNEKLNEIYAIISEL